MNTNERGKTNDETCNTIQQKQRREGEREN